MDGGSTRMGIKRGAIRGNEGEQLVMGNEMGQKASGERPVARK